MDDLFGVTELVKQMEVEDHEGGVGETKEIGQERMEHANVNPHPSAGTAYVTNTAFT